MLPAVNLNPTNQVTTFRVLILCFVIEATASADESVDYLRDIKPILRQHCYSCHGALKQEGSLRLDTVHLMNSGGESGPAIAPNKPNASLLVERITDVDKETRMPLDAEPLSNDQIELIKKWVQQGAVGIEGEKPELDPRQHWAFQKPRRPHVPILSTDRGANNPIDAFVFEQQNKRDLSASPVASPERLLRRIYIDLIGIPPTRDEVNKFGQDSFRNPKSAIRNVTDRLLASPQYGERWGRHWMDVWRYSDWYGRRQVNDVRNSYPHIWRWRDWIIRSLNEDKGYDQMIREMLAADEIAPTDDQAMPAMGFIVRNWFSLNYDTWMKDLVEHTGKAFLGLRMNCAHCHDHKYDPISQEDYFRFRAFFEPLEMRHDRVPGGGVLTKYKRYTPGSGSSLKPIAAGLPRVYDHELKAETFMYRLGDARDRFERPAVAPDVPKFFGSVGESIQTFELPPEAWYPGMKPFARREELASREANVAAARQQLAEARSPEDIERGSILAAETHLAACEAELASARARIAADEARYASNDRQDDEIQQLVRAAAVAEQDARIRQAESQLRKAEYQLAIAQARAEDDPKRKAGITKATTDVKTATAAWNKIKSSKPLDDYQPLGPQYPKQTSGRRTALANWIASPQNPLTARVAVNHIWMRHFGQPLADPVYDLGRSGTQPSHPELLDWLAVELIESGWSMKHVHRLIVTSHTYQQTSNPQTELRDPRSIDPDNRYLWRFPSRRAEAEVIRDSILATADRLDTRIGGQDLATDLEAKSLRRSMYFAIYPEDKGMMKFLDTFDAPDPCDCYRRSSSIVPQQALAMNNSQIMLDSSRALAQQLSTDVATIENQSLQNEAFIRAAFEHVLSRRPAQSELAACREYLDKSPQKTGEAIKLESRAGLIRALYSHNDFVTVR